MRSREPRRLPFRPIVQPGRRVRANFTGTQPQELDIRVSPLVGDAAMAALRAKLQAVVDGKDRGGV